MEHTSYEVQERPYGFDIVTGSGGNFPEVVATVHFNAITKQMAKMKANMFAAAPELLAATREFLKIWPRMRICNASEGKNGCAGCQDEICITAAELKGKFLQAIAKTKTLIMR